MFTNLAYEALYVVLGLGLQERFREIIVSESITKMILLITFGSLFFFTLKNFFSRYIPGNLVKKRSVPLSSFVSLIASLFIGLSLLRVNTTATGPMNYKRESWNDNPYIRKNIPRGRDEFKVNFLFDLMTRSSEEFVALLNRGVDKAFSKTHSQLTAPAFFYKAVMLSGNATIKNEALKEQLDYYVAECFDKFLPLVANKEAMEKMDGFFFRGTNDHVDQILEDIVIRQGSEDGSVKRLSCLDLKTETRSALMAQGAYQSSNFIEKMAVHMSENVFNSESFTNKYVSNMMLNHFLDKKENFAGIHNGALPGGSTGRVIQLLGKKWDGFLGIFQGYLGSGNARKLQGSALAADRANEFSEFLHRAPHVSGFIRLILIAMWPFLCFALVARKWKLCLMWWGVYTSVLCWQPTWTLFYHIITNVGLATGLLEDFGRLYDGVSLYSSQVVDSRMYYMYAVYSWIQILVAPVITGGFLYFMKPLLSDTQQDHAPEDFSKLGKAGVGAAL